MKDIMPTMYHFKKSLHSHSPVVRQDVSIVAARDTPKMYADNPDVEANRLAKEISSQCTFSRLPSATSTSIENVTETKLKRKTKTKKTKNSRKKQAPKLPL